ncbi:hypothetical protein E6P78_12450 [Streptomyces sp. A0958]|uniref:hypothetical protein n=1 Tax=Streptomyces sp. A0958 TaxID=2563101 RepID=UPI00109ECB95|nr:hypothetical protein [Streptomyces sp. A0958]THA69230.1 hypothetical protein E6P78_12450 [Streptomyces sp. A0958]
MPDRRRTAFHRPLTGRATLLMRDRSSSSSSSPSGSSGKPQGDDNPFAPPPEGRPDQPWQPRHPAGGGTDGNGDGGGAGNGGDAPDGQPSDNRPVWGSQWSSKQPGRQNGDFGGRPAGPGGPNGKGGPQGSPAGPRWDPTDPIQRRARYSLLAGMWAFFFAIFDFPEIALLLGALATYWSISALRARPKDPAAGPGAPAPGTSGAGAAGESGAGAAGESGAGAAGESGAATAGGPGQPAGAAWGPAAPAGQRPAGAQNTLAAQRTGRQQTTAAVSGLVTGLVALAIVATTFTVQMVYRDYYTCVNDALTKSGQLACNDLLPKPLEPLFGVKE